MSIRRSLALAGAAALASSMVLAGAQGAAAVGTTGSPSAAAVPQADKAGHQSLDLSVHGVPDTFIAGGDAREFTFKIDNSTKHDFALIPLLKFKNREGSLEAGDLKVEYQLPGGQWLPGSVAPGGGDSDDDAVLTLLGGVGQDGNVADDALQVVNQGKNLTIKVRVSFTKDAPLGKAGVVPVVFSAQLDDKTHEPVGEGHFSCDGIRGAGFTIKAGGTKPSPTGKPTTAKPTTGKPSPTATHSPSATATASPSATATATATTTASPSATTTATASPSATATTTATASPSATATATATSTATASPSATTTPSEAATSSAPAPAVSSSDVQQPIDFPVAVPAVTAPKLTPAAVTKAKAAADNADKALAQTGGGDDTTAIAIAGGAVLAAGAGTLVVLRRRKSASQG
ncbi:LPXTG cell wall anchor domain-containing protein [Kitasatospora sp. NBC_00085]|uniref:LPXTG cell wall anchor domain-containing protein n=1 Tax=unclassified Kitasatospora TaxID=2633591 RepID=UPI003256161D